MRKKFESSCLRPPIYEFWSCYVLLGIVKSDSSAAGVSVCARDGAGYIPPTLLELLFIDFLVLSYSLDQPTNYSHFSSGCFYSWWEEGSWGRRRKWGLSATGCLLFCAVQLMINLSSFFYFILSGPALSCLFTADSCFLPSVLNVAVSQQSPAQACLTRWPTFDPQVGQPYAI